MSNITHHRQQRLSQAVLVLFTALQLAACTPQAAGPRPIVIGGVLPLTGPGIGVSLPYLRGMQLAADEINRDGGIGGRPVRVAAQDGRLDASASLSAFQALMAADDPDAVIAVFGIPAIAIASAAAEAGKPLLYEAYVRSPLKESHVYKAGFDALSGCRTLVQYAKEAGMYHHLGLFMARVEYNELCAQAAREIEPDLHEYWYEFGEQDFRSLLYRAERDGVDTVLTIGIDYEYINLFQQNSALKAPMRVLCATASECIFPGVTDSTDPASLEGTFSIDFVPADIGDSAFAVAYRTQQHDANPLELTYAAAGYDAVHYLARALSVCTAGDLDCIDAALEADEGGATALQSRGFDEHVLTLSTHILEYRGGAWRRADSLR